MMWLILLSQRPLTFLSPAHIVFHLIPHPLSVLKEMGNGLPSACVIWLKLLWFPLRKGWQSPQCWLALRAFLCSYLPSWQQVLQAGRQAGARWLWKLDKAKHILRKLKYSDGSWVWTRLSLEVYTENCSLCWLLLVLNVGLMSYMHISKCVQCSWSGSVNLFIVTDQFLPASGDF